MTSTLSVRASRRGTRKFLDPSTLFEAIEIEEHLIVGGYLALSAHPGAFGLSQQLQLDVEAAIVRHRAVLSRLRAMAEEASTAANTVSPHQEALVALGLADRHLDSPDRDDAPESLVVRTYLTIRAQMGQSDPRFGAVTAMAFLLVAVHAMTDPTNCGTASPALNLVPPPLHRDRALTEQVISAMVAGSDERGLALLATQIGEASACFAGIENADTLGQRLSVVRYNPHSLRTACRSAGLAGVHITG